jgi:hypothetical protein
LVLTHVKFITGSVSWPISAPKLCRVIIATTAEKIMQIFVTEEIETPYKRVIG